MCHGILLQKKNDTDYLHPLCQVTYHETDIDFYSITHFLYQLKSDIIGTVLW
jgi:hypothetical protein